MVALTFDDGPHAEYTDQILDILEENQAVATFFEVAANLYKDPDAVRRAEDMGCEIGSHSYRHANLGKMTLEDIQADLAAADDLFTQVLGHAPTLLRPPYGSINKSLKTGSGRTLVTWSIDTEDWLSRNTEKIVSSVQDCENLDGQVILLHSIYDTSVEATRILVPWLLEQGYQLVTVSELLTLRFRQEIQTNHLYGYSFFRWQVPPLADSSVSPETPSPLAAEPNSKAPIKVKLVLRETFPGESAKTELLGRDLLSLQARSL
jgi:peptidoglycan/xylan/chitin deacetylase (PgdA/CDA1 family)